MAELINKSEPSNEEHAPSDSSKAKKERLVFLLGGKDYEMDRIRRVLRRSGTPYIDKDVSWEGADIKSYQEDIDRILEEGNTPVAVELRGADQVEGVEVIDHHNEKSDRPASLLQVLEKLNIKTSLVNKLAAANDAGYIPAMNTVINEELSRLEARGVSPEKLDRTKKLLKVLKDGIRRKDREMQGVTEEMEVECEEAIKNMDLRDNGLVVVSITGDRYSPITDKLYDTWENGRQNLVVVCNSDKEEKEVWFSGRGDICKKVVEHFKAKKQERIATIPDEPERSGQYHSFGGGQGLGNRDSDAQCLVVATNPEEVISFIEELEKSPNR